MRSNVVKEIPSRSKPNGIKCSENDVIVLSDSSESKSMSLGPRKRRLHPSSSPSPNKRRSLSNNNDSDLEIIEPHVVKGHFAGTSPQGTNVSGPSKPIIRRLGSQNSGISPAPGRNIYANILVKPEIRIAEQRPTRVNLDGGALRAQFEQLLRTLQGPKVSVVNEIDRTSPPSNFIFINENVLGEGVAPLAREWMSGCTCRKENGRHMGCEHLSCECVQHSDVNEKGRRYFPYSGATKDRGCLRGVYLKLRNHVYECNDLCNCENNCKNRVVQHGRQVRLEIFKTKNRGWGLRCPEDLLKGQFIDTYRGEVITNAESNRRGAARDRDHDTDNYLFGLDKFCESKTITKTEFRERFPDKRKWHKELVKSGEYQVTLNTTGEKMYSNPEYNPPVYDIDSKHMGGPSRFINHSCKPNCAIYTVSYNHADENLYDVAFFAIEDIPAGTELTFDYKDDGLTDKITEEMADRLERENGERPIKCLCGTEECRGYFFH